MAPTRRLAAIVFTDMVGYTASTQSDERVTLSLRKEQEDLIHPVLASHQGRIVKSTGDGFLLEFESALKATECALSIQRQLHERNEKAGAPPIQLRIGIHLGDVEQEGTDIFGDAVNIAARIEPVAEPGGICLSGAVYEQVRNKISDKLEKLAPTPLKGVKVPLDIYRVLLPWEARGAGVSGTGPSGIAVLPFANISPDPNDAYFADGLTEELITVLSQLGGLRVIARTSVIPYRSSSKGVAEIGSELRVASILEGSVRKAGTRLRVTAQLIDVNSEGHIWAGTYEKELTDVFAIQAEIAKHVADALRVKLKASEEGRLEQHSPVVQESYEAYLRGRSLLSGLGRVELESVTHAPYSRYEVIERATVDLLQKAKAEFDRSISLDPTNARTCSGLADTALLLVDHVTQVATYQASMGTREKLLEEAEGWAAKALSLDPQLCEAHASLGHILMRKFRQAEAAKELQRAIALNPSYSLARTWFAELLFLEGRMGEVVEQLRLAEESDPISAPSRVNLALNTIGIPVGGYISEAHLGIYYALAGNHEKAREILAQLESADPQRGTIFLMGVLCAYLGDSESALRWLEKSIALGTTPQVWWREATGLESLRRDPRFQELLRRAAPG